MTERRRTVIPILLLAALVSLGSIAASRADDEVAPSAPVAGASLAWLESCPTARIGPALAYDSARGRIVMFGGGGAAGGWAETWEWDGTTWRNATPATSPPGRFNHALAYDSARGRTVLFGGEAGGAIGLLADTWEWDGTTWRNVTPAASPPARDRHALAFDSARGRMVLFGGAVRGGQLADTWEWDGTTWRNVTPAAGPLARIGHALAYDSARGRTVLFGGVTSEATGTDDTWEWDGTTWRNVTPAVSPSPRYGHALAFDSARGHTVLFGGHDITGLIQDGTWEWDGSTWANVPSATSPPARFWHALAYDSTRDRTVLFGGGADGPGGVSVEIQDHTWEWDGTTWANVTASPPGRSGHALAYDSTRDRTVLFGGEASGGYQNDTWEWDGRTWRNVTPATSPPARRGHALAYDSARGRTVLFGGNGGSGVLAGTWEWDGVTWRNVTPAASPPARSGHALAYDSARGRTVLFGGWLVASGSDLADTWEWDGTTWRNVTPAASPPARHWHALAYDSVRGRTVLFGGNGGSGVLAGTWEWDGTTWRNVTPAVNPSARSRHALAYESARGRTLLFGGDTSSLQDDTWEWDGLSWTNVTPPTSPPARRWHALAYDSARGRTVLFGGDISITGSFLADTWEYGQGCVANANCDDGLFCNGVETCDLESGVCLPGPLPSCADGDSCTTDTCDPLLDHCVHAPLQPPSQCLAHDVTFNLSTPTVDVTLNWQEIPLAVTYNSYRMRLGPLTGSPWSYTCLESDDAQGNGTTTSFDPGNPPVGYAFIWLVAGENSCGEGPVQVFSSCGYSVPNQNRCPTPP